jgi:hypothetical protein
MPKRALNLHESVEESEESDKEEIDLTLDDYMENPEAKDIIINQHYFDFEEKMFDILTTIYRKHAYLFSDDSYLKDKEMFNDHLFFNFIYNNIYKDYNNDFIINNEMLQDIVLKTTDLNETKSINNNNNNNSNLNVKTKKFDWATKTYK